MIEAFAWPLSMAMVLIVALLVFRRPLAGFIERWHSVGPTGIVALPPKQPEPAPIAPVENQVQPLYHPSVTQPFRTIASELTEEQRLVLIGNLGVSAFFERIYREIFGSQLALLERLNTTATPMSVDEIGNEFYKPTAERFPELYAEFDAWLRYLEGRQLIRNADGLVTITQQGRDFLKFLVHFGLPRTKAL